MGSYGARAYSRVNNRMANLLLSMEDTDRVLVMVFLNGGNDGLNTVVPLDYLSQLNTARANIVQPESSLIELPGTNLGMHSSMSAMKQLYDEQKLLIIQNVGYDNPNFSHFRSTDIWMSGSDSDQVINSGWTGRYMNQEYPNFPFGYPSAEVPHPLAIEIGSTSSLLFQGPDTKMGLSINDPSFFYDLLDNVEAPVPEGRAGERIELIRILQKQSEQYSLRVKEAAEAVNTQSTYPENELAEKLKIVSRLIAGGLQTRLYLVQLGGFDTHANQVESNKTQGNHSQLLRYTSDSIKAFVDDLEFQGVDDRVLGMVFSEFGRRIKSNFSNGSDHGTAGPMFMFGPNIQPGVIGSNPVIPDQVFSGDNLPHEFDYRQIYSSIFEQWFCVPQQDISTNLLGEFDQLNIVKEGLQCQLATSTDDHRLSAQAGIHIFPSPAKEQIYVEFESTGETANIQVVSLDGKILQTTSTRQLAAGTQTISMNISHLGAGNYFVRYASRKGVQSRQFMKL